MTYLSHIPRTLTRLTASLAIATLGFGAAQAETYNLTMSSSHPTVLPWVGQLSTPSLAIGDLDGNGKNGDPNCGGTSSVRRGTRVPR